MNRLSIAFAAALLALPAAAADLKGDYTAPVGVELVEWSGLHISGHVGYNWGNYDATYKTEKSASSLSTCKGEGDPTYGSSKADCTAAKGTYTPPSDAPGDYTDGSYLLGSIADVGNGEADMNSILWGGGISYNIKRGSIVLTPFIDVSFGGGDFRKSWDGTEQDIPGDLGTVTETGSVSVKKQWDATVGLKGCILITGRDCVGILGGLSYGKFKVSGGSIVSVEDEAVITTTYNKGDSAWGYTVGTYWEHAVTSNLRFGVEGRYKEFSGVGAEGSASKDVEAVNLASSERLNGDYSAVEVLGRITYRLGN